LPGRNTLIAASGRFLHQVQIPPNDHTQTEMTEKLFAASSGAQTGITGALFGAHNYRYWLLVAPVIALFLSQITRGLGNAAYVLYWISAAVLITRQRSFVFPASPLFLYLALLAWGALSAALSVDPHSAYGRWAKYALLGSSYFITWWLVRRIPEFSLDRVLRMIGVVGLASFAFYAVDFLVLFWSPNFQPDIQVHGLVPAYLSPFTLYLLRQTVKGHRGLALTVAYLAGLILLLASSNSLTEVFTLAAALVVLGFFFFPEGRMLKLSLGSLALLLLALILMFDATGSVLSRAYHSNESWFEVLNQLSSYRTYIWHKAITIPPPNQWLGVGPSNVSLYPPVVVEGIVTVRHLHNVFLDCWYEIGVVGLTLFVLLYVAEMHAMKPGIANRSALQRGAMYAAVAGVFVASMLEQSYGSLHVAMFVPFLFALYSHGSESQ
jgi:teichuronic acid biosynthesis protein TuaE